MPTSKNALKIAVIGVGSMGRNHARIFNELENAELVAVVDTNPELAQSTAS
jgi:predicted dehydrogenase